MGTGVATVLMLDFNRGVCQFDGLRRVVWEEYGFAYVIWKICDGEVCFSETGSPGLAVIC